jgi:hypothetical protein
MRYDRWLILVLAFASVFAMLGCGRPGQLAYDKVGGLPPLEQIDCVRIVSGYLHNIDKDDVGRLDDEDLSHLRRMRDGTATRDEWYEPPIIVERFGTVAESYTSSDIEAIHRILADEIPQSTPPKTRGLLIGDLADVILECYHGSSLDGYIISWRADDWFRINPDEPCERWIRSQKLKDALAALAQEHSVRTWLWSNPELQAPVACPNWMPPEERGASCRPIEQSDEEIKEH